MELTEENEWELRQGNIFFLFSSQPNIALMRQLHKYQQNEKYIQALPILHKTSANNMLRQN